MNRATRLPDPEQLAGDLLFARTSSSTALAATTWNAVLDSLEAAARASSETAATADIAQLRSLCNVMDNEAFLPVRVEELTNLEVPRRLIALADLVPLLTEKAVAAGIANRTGLNPTHGWHFAGRYLRIGPAGAWLGIHHEHWSRYGISPFWIEFHDTADFGRASFVLQALKAWAPPRLFEREGRALIPLTILPDVTRERVLEDLLEQLQRLHAELQPAVPVKDTEAQ
jgi:hypothetical protein